MNKPVPQAQKTDDYGFPVEESEEDRIAKLVDARIAKKEALIEKEREERERQEMPQRLQKTFGDFDKVVSTENLDYLEFHHPEIAEPFAKMENSYDKWRMVYAAIKKLVPNTDSKRDASKANANLAKPQSASAGLANTGDTAPVYLVGLFVFLRFALFFTIFS